MFRAAGVCAVLATLVLLGCASQNAGSTRAVWVRGDGSTAPHAEVRAARDACKGEVELARGGPAGHVEWRSRMMTCMKQRGLELAEFTGD